MTRRRTVLVALAAATAAVAVTASAVHAGGTASSSQASASGVKLRQLVGVNFVSTCGFSHRAGDDPIVFPGFPGGSHDHTFVGNTSTNAFSTLATLRQAATTCRRPNDTAGYWMPTLLVDGTPVVPMGATIYYRRHTLAATQPFPAGLEVVAGNSHATAPQDLRVVFWNCGVAGGVERSATPPACPNARTAGLRLHVSFPDCWNGKDLDSPDHHSHMAYSAKGVCPAGYPVAVPAITVIFHYPTAGGPGAMLSSGGQLTGHADFFNAWNQSALARLVTSCLDALRHCGRGI
jgi:Domain of unknown function (DUF1996)